MILMRSLSMLWFSVMKNCFAEVSSVCVENASEHVRKELVVEVSEWLVRKIHNLMSDTVYMMSVRAMTSVGRAAAVSVSAITRPPSRQSASS